MKARRAPVVAALLAAAFLLGTVGIAVADPTTSPGIGPATGGRACAGMIGGQTMMGGAMGPGMMGGLSQDQLQRMRQVHDQMIASGMCDPDDMVGMHAGATR